VNGAGRKVLGTGAGAVARALSIPVPVTGCMYSYSASDKGTHARRKAPLLRRRNLVSPTLLS
jgi:hypothetical protein